MKLEPGSHIGEYELDELLGRGAMGEVWRAHHMRSDMPVAVKRAHASNPIFDQRLAREARLQTELTSPHIVKIFDVIVCDGAPCIIMEFIEGPTLYRFLRQRSRSFAEAEEIAGGLFEGMIVAHGAGVLHRDLKPGNILMEHSKGGWIPKIADFGLAREIGRSGAGPALTKTGFILGTPGYMAPEQIREASSVDERADVFALGTILYQLYTGQRAFRGADAFELMLRTCAGEFLCSSETPAKPPARITNAIEAALAPRLDRRAPDMATLRAIWLGEIDGKEYGRPLQRNKGDLMSMTMGGPDLGSMATESAPIDEIPLGHTHIHPVGRQSEVVEVVELLAHSHVVTLLGPGGIGKTRLAKWVGISSGLVPSDEVHFCDLTEATTRGGVVGEIAAKLGVPLIEQDPPTQLGHAIAARGSILLLLDNAEQVVEHLAPLLMDWLAIAPGVRFLITSRMALSIEDERRFEVPPLTVNSAHALFEMRARAETPGHRFSDEDRAIIRDIVDKLEGMPLAIELAAARTGLLSLSQLRERLVDSLRVLQTTSPGRTSKSLSMRASIDASWALLKPWEKLALAQVCAFHSGFTLDASEAVLEIDHWPDAPWTMDIIHSLIRHSLLRAVSTSDGERRLSLYESIRQYAVEKMNTEGSVQAPSGASLTGEDPNEALQLRHAEYYAQRGLLVSAQLRHEKTMRAATIELQLERDNLIAGLNAAVSRGQGDLAAGCARTLATLCHSQGPLPQGILWLDQALELPSMTVVDRAMLVDLHTQLRYTRVGALTCTGPIEAVLDLPDEPALNGVKASLHSMLWLSTASTKHEPTTAQSHIDEALRLARLSRDWTVQGDVLRRAAVYYIRSGDLDQAAVLLREAMDKFRDRSDIGGQLQVLNNLGAYYMQTGDLLRATSCRQEALVLAKASGNLAWEARLLHNLGEHDFQRLDLDAATRNYRAALEVSRAAGDMMTGMLSSAALGEVSLTRGDYADAEEWFRRALQTEPNTDIPHRPHSELALTYARQGKFDLAGQALEKLQTLPPITNVFEEAKTLARCAEIQFLMGDIKAAKGTLHAASAVCEAHGFGPGSEAHALLEFSRKLLKEE